MKRSFVASKGLFGLVQGIGTSECLKPINSIFTRHNNEALFVINCIRSTTKCLFVKGSLL
ncbi:hypothetical protein E2320_015451 [Naja naja]|nr:hypothetical protein E2320_015451 [Naja naja]